jgi:hypothetical protein
MFETCFDFTDNSNFAEIFEFIILPLSPQGVHGISYFCTSELPSELELAVNSVEFFGILNKKFHGIPRYPCMEVRISLFL